MESFLAKTRGVHYTLWHFLFGNKKTKKKRGKVHKSTRLTKMLRNSRVLAACGWRRISLGCWLWLWVLDFFSLGSLFLFWCCWRSQGGFGCSLLSLGNLFLSWCMCGFSNGYYGTHASRLNNCRSFGCRQGSGRGLARRLNSWGNLGGNSCLGGWKGYYLYHWRVENILCLPQIQPLSPHLQAIASTDSCNLGPEIVLCFLHPSVIARLFSLGDSFLLLL